MTPRLFIPLILLVSAPALRAQVAPATRAGSPHEAVERALPLLQASARTWTEKARCFSCHHQGLGATAVAVARERGYRIDEAMFATQLTAIRGQLPAPEVAARLRPRNSALEDILVLAAPAAGGIRQDAGTDRGVYGMLGEQHAAGHWMTPTALRLPLEGSRFSTTAWAIRALRLLTPANRKGDAEARIRRAVDWLEREPPRETQDLAMQLLAFKWAGAAPERIARARDQLLALQRDDGGWGQVSARPSDAYATGQAVVALTQAAGVSPTSTRLEKALAFLTRTQQADGSWLVETRLTWMPGLSYLESGFPHGKHQFISYAGSAWATMALAVSDRDETSRVLMGEPPGAPAASPPSTARETNGGGELTPLMRAALHGSPDELRALARNDRDVDAATMPHGVTALMCAVHDPAKADILLSAGADANKATLNGLTPLLIAADYDGAAGSVRRLLTKGADPSARGTTPGRVNTPLTRAALHGDRAVAALLLDAGAPINDQPDVSLALISALNMGDVPFIAFLLDRGANLESRAPAGLLYGPGRPTPLMLAADRGQAELVALLLQKGANVHAKDSQGRTPLIYAAGGIDQGSTKVAEALLAAGADVGVRAETGDTALDLASRYGNARVAELLRKAAARAGE